MSMSTRGYILEGQLSLGLSGLRLAAGLPG